MSRYTYKRPSSPIQKHQPAHLWIVAVGGVLSLFIGMGLPDDSGEEVPPPGVEMYRDGNLICWDKVVCCNPDDPSTCTAIPICEIDK